MQNKDKSIFLLAVTHKTAPLAVREQLAITPEKFGPLYNGLKKIPGLEECVALNTCNRFEIYGVARQDDVQAQLEAFLCNFYKIDSETLAAQRLWMTGLETVRHLFEVCAGIDAQVVGETEVLGQIKVAYAQAQEQKSVGGLCNRIFQKSFQAAKWVRTHTNIGRGKVSIGSVAVDLAVRIFGDLKNSRILVVGTGEIGERTLQALKDRGAGAVTVTSRTYENAKTLAHRFGGAAIDFEDFPATVSFCDIIICCTTAPGPILRRETIETALLERPDQPLFLIDLALPRDIEAAVTTLKNVYLYNLDDLTGIADENLKARKAEVDRCRQILDHKAEQLWNTLKQRELLVS